MEIKEGCPEILKDIFNFVISNIELENFAELAKIFVAEKVEKLNVRENEDEINILKKENIYNRVIILTQYDYKIAFNCSSIKGAIKEHFFPEPKFILERQISPSIEAYYYRGNSGPSDELNLLRFGKKCNR